jgi:cell division protein FtsW
MAYKATSDRPLFITANLLAIFGLVMVYSASSVIAGEKDGGVSAYYFLRQLIWAGLGCLMMWTLMNVNYHVWQRKGLIKFLLVVTAIVLVAVLFEPAKKGAHRWLHYRSLSFQPSEIAKLVLLFFVASYLHDHEPEINDLKKRLVPLACVVGFFVFLIGYEPDLGQAVCILLIVSILVFIAGLSWKYISMAAAAATPLLGLAIYMYPYRFIRVLAFLDRSKDTLKSNWQISNSLVAFGSGGTFGLGLGAGKQKLHFLPEAPSDFIFAVIGEEIGLIGTLLVCLAFLFFFYRGVKIALKAPDKFGFYLALGITIMVVMQAFINISMVLGLMPTKGIALPFISQGGSSLLLNLMATGVLLNISNYAEKE